MPPASDPLGPSFQFARDTFAFPNELVWEYTFDPATGRPTTRRAVPPPTYTHRCFVVVRACRQFHLHARFLPHQPALHDADYLPRIRQVLRRPSRTPSPASARLEFPGSPGLREFSLRHEALLKRTCGGAWRSYVLRSHWRMVFPLSRRHQEHQAASLQDALAAGQLPLVHLVRFPQLTINHGLLLFRVRPDPGGLAFAAYDPNHVEGPVSLLWRAASRQFEFPANRYWAGGRLEVIHIDRNWLF